MTFLDWITIVAGILTISSVSVNIIQYQRRQELKRALKARAQASYNYHYRIARACDKSRMAFEKLPDDKSKLHEIMRRIQVITGVADAARSDIIAYSREHLHFLPFYEHPAQPVEPRKPA